MATTPRLKSEWLISRLGRGLFVASNGEDIRVLSSDHYDFLIPLIDGRRTITALAAEIRQLGSDSIYAALSEMESCGLLEEANQEDAGKIDNAMIGLFSASPRPANNLSVELFSIDGHGLAEAAESFVSMGLSIRDGSPVRVVVVRDFLNPALAELNIAAMKSRSPWLIVRPYGRHQWLSPMFLPYKTACWECVATRIRSNIWSAGVPEHFKCSIETCKFAAKEVTRWLEKGWDDTGRLDHIQSYDLVSSRWKLHPITRLPQCLVCGDRFAKSLLRSNSKFDRGESPDLTISILQKHQSPVTGIFSDIRLLNSDCGVFVHATQLNRRVRKDVSKSSFFCEPEWAFGKGLDLSRSLAGCMAEAVERYSLQFHGDEELLRATLGDLGDEAVPLEALLLKSDIKELSRPGPSDWVLAKSLGSGHDRYVPAGFCFIGYGDASCECTTNGCAAGLSLESAALRAFFELVERDAFAIWWYNRISRPTINLESFNSDCFTTLQAFFKTKGRCLAVFDITTDFSIPTAVAISHLPDGTDIILGSGTSLNVYSAIEAAIMEVITLLVGSPVNSERALNQRFWEWRKTETLINHPYLKTSPMELSRDDYSHALGVVSAGHALATCIERATALGLEVLELDMTRPEIGVPVARLIVPGMRTWRPAFGQGRLFQIPVTLGWRSTIIKEEDLNPTPFFF